MPIFAQGHTVKGHDLHKLNVCQGMYIQSISHLARLRGARFSCPNKMLAESKLPMHKY